MSGSVISIKLPSNFIEIALPHKYLPVNLLHIFRTPFYKNNSGGMLLNHYLLKLHRFPACRKPNRFYGSIEFVQNLLTL